MDPSAITYEHEMASFGPQPLALVRDDHPALSRRALAVPEHEFGGQRLADLADRMCELLAGIPQGIGLAAPQVGLSVALFVVDDGENCLTVVNPRPRDFGSLEVVEAWEGCLSLPGFRARTRRPARYTLLARDLAGGHVELEGQGLLARIFSHESDHLNGRLYLTRIVPGSLEPDVSEPMSAVERRRWSRQPED